MPLISSSMMAIVLLIRPIRTIQLLIAAFVLIFILMFLMAALARAMNRGGCGGMAAGCCLFEMIDSIVSALTEVGCALLGCGGALLACVAPVGLVAWLILRHHS